MKLGSFLKNDVGKLRLIIGVDKNQYHQYKILFIETMSYIRVSIHCLPVSYNEI